MKRTKPKNFTIVPNYIIRCPDRPNVVRVLCVIASYAWEGSSCTASGETIGRDARVSRDTVFDAIRIWEQRGQIRVDRSNVRGLKITTTFDYTFDYSTDAPWVTTKRPKREKGLKKAVLAEGLRSPPASTTAVSGEALSQSASKDGHDLQTSTAADLGEGHKEDPMKETKDKELLKTHSAQGVRLKKVSSGPSEPAQASSLWPAAELCLLFITLNINKRLKLDGFSRAADECLEVRPLAEWSEMLHRYAKCKEASDIRLDRYLPVIRNPRELLEKRDAFIAYETRKEWGKWDGIPRIVGI